MGVATAILSFNKKTKPISLAFNVFSSALNTAGIALTDAIIANNITSSYGSDILNTIQKSITGLKAAIVTYSTIIGSSLGSTWNTFSSESLSGNIARRGIAS